MDESIKNTIRDYFHKHKYDQKLKLGKNNYRIVHTGFFDRNVIFKLLIFQPKNQYFSEPKYVLRRLLWDILKNKCRLWNNDKENCEIICCW